MSKQIYIYGLYDPFTMKLRYVGKTQNLTKRLWEHIKEAKGGQGTHKGAWIRKLLRKGEKPIIASIQKTTKETWQNDEKKCIAQAKVEGANLVNHTKGGDGIPGYKHSEETKQKISEYNKEAGKIPPSWKGHKQSPEHIRKRVEARKKKGNYKHSKETKKKISQNRTGKNLDNTHTLGMKHTDEWKRAASERMKGQNNPFYGRQHTEETKKKISETKRRRKLEGEK